MTGRWLSRFDVPYLHICTRAYPCTGGSVCDSLKSRQLTTGSAPDVSSKRKLIFDLSSWWSRIPSRSPDSRLFWHMREVERSSDGGAVMYLVLVLKKNTSRHPITKSEVRTWASKYCSVAFRSFDLRINPDQPPRYTIFITMIRKSLLGRSSQALLVTNHNIWSSEPLCVVPQARHFLFGGIVITSMGTSPDEKSLCA